MIHRKLGSLSAFDAMFLTAITVAAYIDLGHAWLIYPLCIMTAVSTFVILCDISSWFTVIAQAMRDYTRIFEDVGIHGAKKIAGAIRNE